MENMQPYIDLYVKRKKELFPLMIKYSDLDPKTMNYGDSVALYVWLLRNNEQFRTDAEGIIQKYNNAIDLSGLFDQTPSTTTLAPAPTTSNTKNAGGFFSGIVGTIGNVFTSVKDYKTAQEEQDTVLYETILQAQGGSDLKKILIMSGIALAFITVAVIVVIKMKKK